MHSECFKCWNCCRFKSLFPFLSPSFRHHKTLVLQRAINFHLAHYVIETTTCHGLVQITYFRHETVEHCFKYSKKSLTVKGGHNNLSHLFLLRFIDLQYYTLSASHLFVFTIYFQRTHRVGEIETQNSLERDSGGRIIGNV